MQCAIEAERVPHSHMTNVFFAASLDQTWCLDLPSRLTTAVMSSVGWVRRTSGDHGRILVLHDWQRLFAGQIVPASAKASDWDCLPQCVRQAAKPCFFGYHPEERSLENGVQGSSSCDLETVQGNQAASRQAVRSTMGSHLRDCHHGG